MAGQRRTAGRGGVARHLMASTTTATLLACSGGPPVPAAQPSATPSVTRAEPPPPAPSAAELSGGMRARIAVLRDALAGAVGCADTCCLDPTLGVLDAAPSPRDSQDLAALVASDADAATRAVAARMLRWTHDLSVLAAIAACLDSREPGPPLPQIFVGQGFAPCPGAVGRQRSTVGWEAAPLADVCLETAGYVTARFLSRDEYLAWRSRYPEPRDSPELWAALLERQVPAEEWVLAELERHATELLGRVVLTHPRGLDGLSLSAAEVAARARLTPERAITAIVGPESWPELAAPVASAAYVRNLALGWRGLFGAELGPSVLERLWVLGVGTDDPPTRAWLAWALADVLPARRSAALREGLVLAPAEGEVTVRLLESLAATEAVAESARLGAWFTRPPPAVPSYALERYQVAILTGLARPGAPRPAALPTILRRLPPDSAAVLEAAAAAARNHGCSLPAAECAELAPRAAKGGPSPAEEARAGASRRRCHELVVACAARSGR